MTLFESSKFLGLFLNKGQAGVAASLPRTVGWRTKEMEERTVDLLLHGLRGFTAEIAEDAVVEDDVVSQPFLD